MESLTSAIFSTAILVGLIHGIYWLPQKISLPRSLFKTIPVALLAFAALFLTRPSPPPPTDEVMIAVWILTVILILLVLTGLWRHLAEMKIPVFIYTLAIGTMNISAWISGQDALLLAGVGLFVLSDMVLAHELFVWQKPTTKKIASFAVWFSYFFAQVFIMYSLI